MARRSARLQKRSTTPADTPRKSSDSWQTASSPHLELPSLPELPDPNMKTPQKPAVGPVSRLPQATPTLHKSTSSKSLFTAATSRTPKDRTPIKPAGQEMHPAHHHASTAKVLDEARWLGFQALGAFTAPPKAMAVGQVTPSKTPVPTPANKAIDIKSSPEFRFRFKSPFSTTKSSKQDEAGLSPSTRNILKDAAISGTPGGGSRALFGTTEFSTKADMSPQRKKVEPKGKMARFSDVHMSQFKKMDSIANHPSAFRADPNRFKPIIGQPLKKSPSKPDLAKPEPNKLKRTQSKMDIAESSSKAASGLKRTQSKMDLGEPARKLPPTPSKPTPGLPRSQSTVRLVPETQIGRPASREGASNPYAKRVKRTESDDAATNRPKSSEGKPVAPVAAAPTPARKITSQTALPRLAARLMTPTKSSIARSQSVKATKSTSMIPSLTQSPSTNNFFSPAHIAQTMRDNARESMRKATSNLQRVRSILRTPSRKFSDDPSKIVAGTHMSPPPAINFGKALPPVPATAPVKKHVNFTSSTLERTADIEINHSPSPVKFRAGSEMPTGAVVYPTLQPSVQYPELSQDDETPAASPSRRLTFGGEAVNQPRSFSFDSGKPINFGPASTGTIRMVRKSDASSFVDKKRKLDTLQETSDKENDEPAEEDMRSAKKMKPAPPAPPKTPASTSKLPRRTPARGSAISKSRLNFLATPKRNKA
ncbi:hypothetical protein N0V83_010864 [Neocucurbitaria cava]|uniref:Uncharacterized protein n=1 Tax=Neocucurbitaria cava TaxID=798079 RepID=A0A9W8XY16_9PLEO|nr:hypothetical protein N0V83_010864 [Neocucurbitaria cava]